MNPGPSPEMSTVAKMKPCVCGELIQKCPTISILAKRYHLSVVNLSKSVENVDFGKNEVLRLSRINSKSSKNVDLGKTEAMCMP